MKFYIVEDDLSVTGILENLIEEAGFGTVCGSSEGGSGAVEEILAELPDIVLVDLLMPKQDGISLIRELRGRGCRAKFVMLSQISAKEIIAKAYQAGIEFFVQKPVNQIEICSVLRRVEQELKNERMLSNIRSMFREDRQPQHPSGEPHPQLPEAGREALEQALSQALGQLGMLGERGTKDIIRICLFMHDSRCQVSETGLGSLCRSLSEEPKSMEQRIRRAVSVGMKNLAHIGIEDYMNDTFVTYSNTLFSFEEIRAEMDFVRGKRSYGGKTDIKKFLDSLLTIAEQGLR